MRDHDKKNDLFSEDEANDESTESTVSDSQNNANEFQDNQEAHTQEANKKQQQQAKEKNNHTKKQEELKEAFGKTSKVMGRSSFWKKKSSFILVIAGVVVVIFIIGGHHHEETKKEEQAKHQKAEELTLMLKKRLDKMKNEKDPLAEKSAAIGDPSLVRNTTNEEGKYTKEMIARMNAPTSIYESGSSATVSSTSVSSGSGNKKEVKEATFIGSGANQDFGNANYQTTSVDAKQVPHPESTIMSGEMIHATLNVAMDSDLPGMVTATVSSPAYSYTGENELIPRGSRLIGQYSSAVLQGQDRIFIMWNRVVLPNGISVDINSPDTDQIGQAGEPADYINRHFWSRFGESILLSILSAGVSNVDVQSSDQYNSAQAYRIAMAESLQSSATGTLQQTISTKPTLVRYQGAMINVFIAHDLSFYNVLNQEAQE